MKNLLFIFIFCISTFLLYFLTGCDNQATGSVDEEIAYLRELSRDFTKKNLDSAKIIIDSMLTISRANNSAKGFGRAYLSLGTYHFKKDEYDKALYCFDTAKYYGNLASDDDILTDVKSNKGVIYLFKDSVDIAKKYLKEAIEIRRKSGSYYDLGKQIGNYGIVFQLEENYDKAVEYYKDAIDTLKLDNQTDSTKVNSTLASNYNNIGVCLRLLPDWEQALKYLFEGLELQKKLGNEVEYLEYYSNIGIVYDELDSLDKALHYYTLGYEISQKLDRKVNIARDLFNIGTLLVYKGKFKEAEEMLNKSFSMKEALELERETITGHIGFAELYLATNRIEKARESINTAVKLATELGLKEQLRDALYIAKEVYAKKGNYKKAYDYGQRHSAIQDSIFKNVQLKISHLNGEREKEAKERAQEAKKKQEKLNMAQQQTINVLIIFSIIFLGFIAFILYQNLRIKKKNNEISALHSSHRHQTKTDLTTIITLLSAQSSSVEEIKYRVDAIAQLHQLLFSPQAKDKKTYSLNVELYLNEVLQNLQAIHRKTGIKLDWDIANSELSVPFLKNIGIIVSELVVNSYKYAFDNSIINPAISVTLEDSNNTLKLTVSDNGIGLIGSESNRPPNATQQGQKLTQQLVGQFNGKHTIDSTNGVNHYIEFLKTDIQTSK